MTKDEIIKGLSEMWNQNDVEKFASYCMRLLLEKNKNWDLKNPRMQSRKSEDMITLFKRVDREGLVFDWEHITLQSTGVSYDYVALKNKMLIVYPESVIDINLVYEWDDFDFWKESWKVVYKHKINNPFEKKDDKIVGAYTIIKNKRGEFLTLLWKEDLEKHRKTAKTDYIWKQRYSEMCMKTIMKKACKLHFGDIFTAIEEMDNENYELENTNDIDLEKTTENFSNITPKEDE